MNTDQHCPECGAIGSVRREPFEEVVMCPNDDCPRIILSVNSRVITPPSIEAAADRLMHDLDKIYTVLP